MDIFETLKEYKKLLDADIITQAEFDLKKAELLKSTDITGDSENAKHAESAKNATVEEQTRPSAEALATKEEALNQHYDADLSDISNSKGARKVASILCLIGFIGSVFLSVYALYFTLTTTEHAEIISTVINIIETIEILLITIMLFLLWRLLRKNKGYVSNTIGSVSLVCFIISGLILICCLVLVLRKMLLNHPSLTFDTVEVILLAIAFFVIWKKADNNRSRK